MSFQHGTKQAVLDYLRKYKADSAVAIAKAIGHPRQRVSNTLTYLKNCGVVERNNFVWILK